MNTSANPAQFPSDLFDGILPRATWVRPPRNRVVLYGAGGLGKLALELLEKARITPAFFIDMHAGGQTLEGIPVLKPSDITEIPNDATVLVCVVTSPYEPIRRFLSELGFDDVRPFYDAAEYLIDALHITNGWLAGPLDETDMSNIADVHRHLADDKSRAAYLQMLNWRIHRRERPFPENHVTMEDKWFPQEIQSALREDEIFVDAGAYDGEVIDKFLKQVDGRCAGITALEPDADNFNILQRHVETLPPDVQRKISLIPKGLGAAVSKSKFMSGRNMASFVSDKGADMVSLITLDSLDVPATFLKLHIEGSELDAIRGGIRYLQKHRPLIALTTYHNEDGLWRTPHLLMESLADYVFFMRTHAWCGISSILYAIPSERYVPTHG